MDHGLLRRNLARCGGTRVEASPIRPHFLLWERPHVVTCPVGYAWPGLLPVEDAAMFDLSQPIVTFLDPLTATVGDVVLHSFFK